MDFYFSGDLDNLKDYIDFNSIDLKSEGGNDKNEFKFFNGKTPTIDDLIMTVDGCFDPEYDVLGSRFLFVVSPDENELKKAVLEAEEKEAQSPFFPMDWEEDGKECGKEKYILNYVLCFDNFKDCAQMAIVLMESIKGNGFFNLDLDAFYNEFGTNSKNVKIIKSAKREELIKNNSLKGTFTVFYCNKDKDAMELVFESKKDFSFENSSSESHFLQLFYVNEDTYYKCFYWC